MMLLFVGVVLCAVSWCLIYESLSTVDQKREVGLGSLAILLMALGLTCSIFGLGVM